MNAYLFFYLVTLAGRLHEILRAFIPAVVAGSMAVFSAHLFFSDYDFKPKSFIITIREKWIAFLKITVPLSAVLYLGIPSRNDLLLIAAGGTIGEYAKADTNLRQIPHELTDWVRQEIKKAKEDKE